MLGKSILVLTSQRQTRRQVTRALGSGGLSVHCVEQLAELGTALEQQKHDLVILDCDGAEGPVLEEGLRILNAASNAPPVVLLSMSANKTPLMGLVRDHDVSNLVAKHGAIRAVYPMLDERELLVTCEKVIRRSLFGVEKYVGSWGVVLHRARVTSLADKLPVLGRFEQYLLDLDCPSTIIPHIVNVAEELILNAVIHAPRMPDGTPKYESIGPRPDLVLEPNEYVDLTYGCDGQRLMLSVSDNFGGLHKRTLHEYLSRGFDEMAQLESEMKPSGAGLGLSLSFRSIHQLIFNIHDRVRTEVIAGWYLRINTANEFRQVGKSFNLFWLPTHIRPLDDLEPTGGRFEAAGPGLAVSPALAHIHEQL